MTGCAGRKFFRSAPDEYQALLVRVTGFLLFDSEHFIKNHLVRVNKLGDSPSSKTGVLYDRRYV